MFRTDGVRGMFKGNGLNCIRIVPNQGGWRSLAGSAGPSVGHSAAADGK
jgi:hypothetical protein